MRTANTQCRQSLTAEDFQFIATALASPAKAGQSMVALLTDESARDAALESDRLLKALLETPRPLPVSPRLYFYVLTRRALALFDRETSDYIASVLVGFLDVKRLRSLPEHLAIQADYVTGMLAGLSAAPSDAAFAIRVHVGNYSLFMTGVFPEHIRHRADRRGAPDIAFYEEVGSDCYRVASDHQLARRNSLADIYRTISEQFTQARCGLNRLADQLMCIEPVWSVDR